MPDRSSSPVFDAADEEVVRYHALSSLAVVGLLTGLLSPLAMFAPAFWLVPLVAVLLSSLALRRIAARWPDLVGRPAALTGLTLGTVFLVAAPVEDFAYRQFLRQQARQFAEMWIDAVRHGEVYKAHQLMMDAKHRSPLEAKVADAYRKNKNSQKLLEQFVKEPVIRTLFALGQDGQIRFYETAADGPDFVQETYAVTFPDEQKKPKSFFITLFMQRSIDASSRRASWMMVRVNGGVRPPGW